MSHTVLPHIIKCSFAHTRIKNTLRSYGKNILRRRAVRVLNLPKDPVAPIREDTFLPKVQLTAENIDASIVPSVQQNIIVPPYEKLQKVDSRFTKTLYFIKSRKFRERSGKILLEGKRLINDAINAGVELKTIYFSREKDLAEINLRRTENVEVFKVLYGTLKLWSDLTTCPGVMGVFKKPSVDDINLLSEPVLPVTVLCDNIRDPGNLGSVIRNAAAAGCQSILLLKGCVDPWEAKVLKAGCGGHFRVPIVKDIEWTHLSNYINSHSKIFIADNSADIDGWEHGPEFINYDESIEDVDEDQEDKKYVTINEHNQAVEIDETFNEPSELEKFEDIKLPCYLYSSIKYPKNNIVLYIGGETHGVDERMVKLSCDYGGKKIKIPLENSMDSLNSSFALTIILYEIKRQFSEKYVTK